MPPVKLISIFNEKSSDRKHGKSTTKRQGGRLLLKCLSGPLTATLVINYDLLFIQLNSGEGQRSQGIRRTKIISIRANG